MKYIRTIISVILVIYCASLIYAYIGGPALSGDQTRHMSINYYEYEKELYKKHCAPIRQHNEWVRSEHERISNGKRIGILIAVSGTVVTCLCGIIWTITSIKRSAKPSC